MTTQAQIPSMKPFFTLWAGQRLSLIGSNAVQFGIIWWLTRETGSATMLALATLLGLAPQVVLGPVIGSLIDRWDRKRIMLLADGFVAAGALVLAVLFVGDWVRPEYALALLFIRALGSAFHAPAMTASTSLMVPESKLTHIQGLNQSVEGLSLVVAAPLGAFLFALLPMEGLLLVDVATALIAMGPLLFIHVPRPARVAQRGSTSIWRDTADGFRYVRNRGGLVAIVFLAAGINVLVVPAMSLLPLLVLNQLQGSAAQLGWISSAFGVGMLIGGALLGMWGGFSKRIATALWGMLSMGIAILALGFTPPGMFWWALTSMFALGFFVPLVNGPIQAVVQVIVPADMQGRVFTLLGSMAGAAAPLGLLLAAPGAETLGLTALYAAGGVACIVAGSVGFFIPALMRLEDEPGQDDLGAETAS